MKIFGITSLVLTAFLVSGCASNGQSDAGFVRPDLKDPVALRAEARWKAMIEKDLDKAYEFLSPGSKAAFPLALFKGRIRPLDWRAAKAISVSCEVDTCLVKVSVTVNDKRFGGEVTTVVPETWLKDGGEWWLVFN